MRVWLFSSPAAMALLVGCQTVPGMPVAAPVVAMPSRSLVFTKLHAEEREGSVLVTGKVARRSIARGPIWGHLHIEALSNAEVIAWTDTRWRQLSRRKLPASAFYAELPVSATGIDQIRVSHMPEGHGGERHPGNSE